MGANTNKLSTMASGVIADMQKYKNITTTHEDGPGSGQIASEEL